MSISKDRLFGILSSRFVGGYVSVKALADDGDHYHVVVAHDDFKGISRVEQHKLVYKALEGESIHALQISTSVPVHD